ncbi:hypothetical protein GDO78_013310 [Eleutherodactylus coqui]|uniref:Uncharacterized protein n=1 Tax=Eleutherodactylus coqui TaxID=57060 RepID=A0A8J6EZX0_ELECQ|nr:hypothetical protein GDO78_013310 [Eleutherodactylus coqui]
MGVLQMAESERSGNTKSKDQEKPRKPSTESSQSPKAAQPSCLREAFIRIFPKRAEPNNKTEEDPSSNQNTDDQAGVRGKRRRVTGSIFRLPCLRPAETTGNDIQNKTEEQSNDVVQEEELKPYSKASFLRKIRCYRLMREKDATEKEKVIEMAQRKHDRENAEVKQCKERVIEQSEEGLQSMNQDEVVGEKETETTEQGCHAKKQDVSLGKQECCTGKLHELGKDSVKIEDPAQDLGEVGKDSAEQESCVETLKEKSVLLDVDVSLPYDKNLAEQESQIRKVEKLENVLDEVKEQKKEVMEQKLGNVDNALSDSMVQPEEVRKQEKRTPNQKDMEIDLPAKESRDLVIVNTGDSEGTMQKCSDELRDAGNYLSEQKERTEKVGNTENNLSGQQCLEEDMENTRNCLPEQDSQKEMKELETKGTMTGQNSQGDIADKLKIKESHGKKEDHSERGGDQKNNLVDQDGPVENTMKEISNQDSQYTMKDAEAEILGELVDNTTKVSGVSSDAQNVTNTMSNPGFISTILNQEFVSSETFQRQDSPVKMTLGSEDNEELASVRKKTTTNDIITYTSSEVAHTQVLGLQKEVLTSTITMDLTYQDPHIHTYVNNKEDDMGCGSKDLGSLREEVKDMVEWLVQEASDRLSHYAQEAEGTG